MYFNGIFIPFFGCFLHPCKNSEPLTNGYIFDYQSTTKLKLEKRPSFSPFVSGFVFDNQIDTILNYPSDQRIRQNN